MALIFLIYEESKQLHGHEFKRNVPPCTEWHGGCYESTERGLIPVDKTAFSTLQNLAE